MVRSTPWTLALIAVGAFTCLASLAGPSFADDSEGVVRICDQVTGPGGSCPQGGACRGGGCRGGGCRSGYCNTCRGQGCPQCNYGNCNNGACGNGCYATGHVWQFINWFHPFGQCPHSPDYGYAPPGKVHTPYPQQVAYRKGFPDAWTGQQGAGMGIGGPRAVSIYMPTDTTQLGYYYQAVPRWQAYRGMVPGTPTPSLWHQDLCQGQGCRYCGGNAAGGCPHCHGQGQCQGQSGNCGQTINNGVIETQPQPAELTPAPAVQPQPLPVEPEAAPATPPAAPLEKAENPNLQPIN